MRAWADDLAEANPVVRRVGYFGSYARGDWGVGSDLDLLIVVETSDLPIEARSAGFDTTSLPVPVDLLVYTTDEWDALAAEVRPFMRALRREAVWVISPQD
ncbi:MAG TPA: nucleotidyltransferase domain-containing protein [Longimicrobiaceae bacterium]|nr:nucleotidyltransferase domain-containing protein [Longimicrobiaceae bacterium]